MDVDIERLLLFGEKMSGDAEPKRDALLELVEGEFEREDPLVWNTTLGDKAGLDARPVDIILGFVGVGLVEVVFFGLLASGGSGRPTRSGTLRVGSTTG